MPSRPPRVALLASPTLRAEIAAELRRRGIARDDLPDLVQETLTRALAVRNPPRDLAQCRLLTRVIARNVAIDHVRRKLIRRRYDSTASPDDQPASDLPDARDPVDGRRQLSLMKCEAELGRLSGRALEIVHAVSERVPQTTIAAELGLGHQTVRNELHRARRLFKARWRALEAIADRPTRGRRPMMSATCR
jgi:DNA-directed RNA polymerase specialized sigma24 family protein